jgi:hypothetical protein
MISRTKSATGRSWTALFYRRERMAGLKEQLRALGAETFEPLRASLNERFFFREPVNGYVFEIIARD